MTFREPPSGWYTFGTHAGWDHDDMPRLEFSEETDEARMPLFERPRMTAEPARDTTDDIAAALAEHGSDRLVRNPDDLTQWQVQCGCGHVLADFTSVAALDLNVNATMAQYRAHLAAAIADRLAATQLAADIRAALATNPGQEDT